MTLTQNITLDVARETALHIAGKQFDENSRFLLVTIKEAGEEKSIPAGSTITLNARRPDGSAQSFAGSIQDGKALVEIDQWILEQYGTVYCSVSVVDSEAAKLTTLSFRLLVERAEGSGFVLVYVAAANLPAGTYYIPMAGVNYSFTTTQAVPAGGKIYFSSNGTTGKTTNNGATIEELTLTAGSTGTELQGSDIVNFLTQMQANVAAIDGELDSKADKSAIEENLAAGTSLATIDKNSYTSHNAPYLHRISPSGKRCEYDVIGGTVGWNQLIDRTVVSSNTVQGLTININSDGLVHIEGTSTATSGYINFSTSKAVRLINQHKYIIMPIVVSNTGTTTMSAYMLIYGNGGNIVSYGNTNIVAQNTETTGASYLYIRPHYSFNGTLEYYINLIDLTTLLGSPIADYAYQLEQTTAGSGIAWLKSFGFLTKSYYPYSEPTLESVQATARVARGINQWDEEWVNGFFNDNGVFTSRNDIVGSKNAIRVMPNTTYYFNAPITGMFVTYWRSAVSTTSADATQLISRYQVPNTKIFTTPTDCQYIHFNMPSAYGSTYLNNVCINLSNPTINGQYFPYESHTYPLGNVTLRGIPKLDSSNNIYYDGDVYKADGTITRRRKSIDLGTLTYRSGTPGIFYSNVLADTPEFNESTLDPKVINTKYLYSSSAYGSLINDKVFCINGGRIWIVDTAYSDVAIFKSAMSGVMFEYPLATPTTESTDSFTPIQYTGSTEEFTTSNDVPVGVDARYYTDLTLPTLPTANGTYTLKCTVTDGTGIVSWVSE